MKNFCVAVVGATGAVGQTLLSILQEREFPVGALKLFASNRSQGREIEFQGRKWICETLQSGCFEGVDFCFFDAGDEVSRQWVREASEAGAWVIDHCAATRGSATRFRERRHPACGVPAQAAQSLRPWASSRGQEAGSAHRVQS